MPSLRFRIGRFDDHRTGAAHLEGDVTVGRDAGTVGNGRILEVEHAVGHYDGVLLAAMQVEVVAHHFFLDGAGEVLRVGKVPGLVAGERIQGKVLRLLHIGSPPLGSAHLLAGDIGTGQDIEQSARSIVAGRFVQDRTSRLREREIIGEVSGRNVEEPVVGRRYAQVGSREVFGVGTRQDSLPRHVQEEVVLEREAAGFDLKAKDTAIVGIVHKAQVEQGVVLKRQGSDGHVRIQTHEGTHTLRNRIVDEGNGLDGRGLADVKDITAHGTVLVDIQEVAAVVQDVAQHQGFAPFIQETLGVIRNDAIPIGNVADILSFLGSAVLVLEGETETGRRCGRRRTVEGNVLEEQVLSVPGIGDMEFTRQDGAVSVGIQLTDERETGGNIHCFDIIRRAFQFQVNLGTGSLDGALQGGQAVHRGKHRHIRSGPGIELTAGGTLEEEDELILGSRFQTGNDGSGGSDVVRRQVVSLFALLVAGQTIDDPVNVGVVGHFLAPGKGYGRCRTVRKFQEEIVLDGKGLDGLAIEGHLGILFAVGLGLNGEIEGPVRLEFLLERNVGRRNGFGQIDVGHVGVVADGQEIILRIFRHIPGEGHHVTQRAADLGTEVHRLQAAGQAQIGHLVEFLAGATRQKQEAQGKHRDADILEQFHNLHNSTVSNNCSH